MYSEGEEKLLSKPFENLEINLMSQMKTYDVFLSHNSQDKPLVEKIGRWLEDDANLIVWLDKWNLIPGDPWQEGLENALDESKCCAVFLGPNGIGAWQNEEMRSALDERVSKKSIRVVPVLLPGATRPEKESELPGFLRRLTWVEFRKDWQEEGALHRLVCGIKGIPPGRARSETLTDVCPFRGLEVFREQDRRFFFGREAITQRLMDRLSNNRFLAVLGPSGSGKSSVVQAGLIPQFRKTSLIALCSPRERPIEELAFALRTCFESKPPTEGLIHRLKDSEDGLHFISRELVENESAAEDLLIVIDQFEELFTQAHSEKERRQFLAVILKAIETTNGPTSVILTMRSDFLGKCAVYSDLNTFINDHFIQLEPMSREELRSAIEEPAHLAGLVCEKRLVERILNEIEGAPGELPLLEFVLTALWEKRRGGQMLHSAYEDSGGLHGAIAGRADEAFDRLTAQEQQSARRVFLQLVRAGEDTEYTRRRIAISEAGQEVQPLLLELANARLVVTGRDEATGQETVEVAHEALIRSWSRLRDWLDQDREFLLWRQRMWAAQEEWTRTGREDGALLRGTSLSLAEGWLTERETDLSQAEQEFIKAGLVLRDRERIEREKRRQRELKRARFLVEAKKKQADAESARAKMQTRINIGLSFIILLILVGILFYFYGYVKEHVEYYNTFIRRWGSPIGIGKLSKEQAKSRAVSLRFTRKGRYRPIQKVQVVNRLGELTSHYGVGDHFLYIPSKGKTIIECEWQYVRDANDQVIYEKAYDKKGNLVWGLSYSLRVKNKPTKAYFVGADGFPRPWKSTGVEFVESKYSEKGDEISIRFFDRTGRAQQGFQGAYGFLREFDTHGFTIKEIHIGPGGRPIFDGSGSAMSKGRYDELGNLVEWSFFDTEEQPIHRKEGYHKGAAEYNEHGDETEKAYFDKVGEPILHKEGGYHKATSKYDKYGNKIEWAYFDKTGEPILHKEGGYHKATSKYDKYGNQIEWAYFDKTGEPILHKEDGYHKANAKYDQKGNGIESAFFDTAGMPMLFKESFHKLTGKYDEQGNQIEWAYFDTAGIPMLSKDGYHRSTAKYDEHRNKTGWAYFDKAGEPILLKKEGYHKGTAEYNEQGDETEKAYFDKAGEPILHKEGGYHKETSKYDESENQIELAFFDKSGEPILVNEGYHIVMGKYDEQGNRIEWAYFDERKVAIITTDLYHRETGKYDEHGNRIEWAYYEERGIGVRRKNGHHKMVAKYDLQGNRNMWAYFDKSGDPMLNEDNYHRATTNFDEYGNVTKMAFFDKTEKPTLNKDNYHKMTEKYDEHGNQIEWACFDTAGKPTFHRDGYHKMTGKYDEQGKLIELGFLDTRGAPMLFSDGYHKVTGKYDEQGNRIEWAYFDKAGVPMLFKEAYHKETGQFDKKGNRIEWAYFDTAGVPSLLKEGFHRKTAKYDEYGNQIEWAYFWQTGGPILHKEEGYHKATAKYDEPGNQIEMAFFDKSGEPILHKEGGYHKATGKYDERGNEVESAYFDSAGVPMLLKENYHRTTVKYDKNGKQIEWAYFGQAGEAVLHKEGYHLITTKYDKVGNRIEQRLFDTERKPALCIGKYHRWAAGYDSAGKMEFINHYDAEGRIIGEDTLQKKLQERLAKRPPREKFREQLYWLVELINLCKNSGNPTLIKGGKILEDALNYLLEFLKTDDVIKLKDFARHVEQFDRIIKAYAADSSKKFLLGVSLTDIEYQKAIALGLESTNGALVSKVFKDTPAENAGLKSGDIIIEFAGEPVKTARDLIQKISKYKAGDQVEFIFRRENKIKTLSITLGKKKTR